MSRNEVGTEIPSHIESKAREMGLNLKYIYEDEKYGDKCPASNPGGNRPSARFKNISSANKHKICIDENCNWVFFESPTHGYEPPQKKVISITKPLTEEEHENNLQQAKNFEKALKYEDAAKIYEILDMWDDAGRVRKIAKEEQTPQMKVDIGEIDRSVSISDSIVQRSTIGGEDEMKINICPYCGEKLNFPEIPRFCPYCEKQILK